MKICELKNKILEVLAYARTVSKRNGHTGKYAKRIVALVVKQTMHFTDKELTEFLSTNEMGRILGYKIRFNHTIFSKVRKNAANIVKELYELLVYQKMKVKQIRLAAIDSTGIQAFSSNDKEAKYGHRTPSKREQRTLKDSAKTLFFGYKLHAIADAETEVPIAVEIAPANRHDKTFFHRLYAIAKETFRIQIATDSKFLADAGYDSTDIYIRNCTTTTLNP